MNDKSAPSAKTSPQTRAGRRTTTETICEDLAKGEVTARTPMAELAARYGADCWTDYKIAMRDYSIDHGCLVLVDDENDGRCVAMMEHFGEVTPEKAGARFTPALKQYVAQMNAEDQAGLPENDVHLHPRNKTRFSVYRLPFGDYSDERQSFFDERAAFVWQTYA